MKKILAEILIKISLLGGANVIEKFGWFLIRAARLDYVNQMDLNGEFTLQSVLLRIFDKEITVIDCGANIGDWSKNLIDKISKRDDISARVICFEPASSTFAKLKSNMESLTARTANVNVEVQNKALSDKDSKLNLTIVHELAGSNNINGVYKSQQASGVEVIDGVRLDTFIRSNSIDKIDFMKIDAEGFDYFVVLGAMELIEKNKIDFIQFEYNWFWTENNCMLKNVFDLFDLSQYQVAKISPKGLIFYNEYHYSLENYIEANYLIMSNKHSHKLKKIFSV